MLSFLATAKGNRAHRAALMSLLIVGMAFLTTAVILIVLTKIHTNLIGFAKVVQS